MRTNIVLDDKLMRDTLRATGLKTKRAAVELGLQTLLRLRKQAMHRLQPVKDRAMPCHNSGFPTVSNPLWNPGSAMTNRAQDKSCPTPQTVKLD